MISWKPVCKTIKEQEKEHSLGVCSFLGWRKQLQKEGCDLFIHVSLNIPRIRIY